MYFLYNGSVFFCEDPQVLAQCQTPTTRDLRASVQRLEIKFDISLVTPKF